LCDAGRVIAAKTDQRRHPPDHLLPGVVPPSGIDRGPQRSIGPAVLDQTAGLVRYAFTELPHLVDGPTDFGAVQKVIPLLRGVAAHGGENRLRFGGRGGDLLAQRVDFGGESIDNDANVVGDLLDLVFVLIGQKFHDFFHSGHWVTDARQQVQDRRVNLVDLGRICSELSRDGHGLLQDSGCAATGVAERRRNLRSFGDLLGADAAHRPHGIEDFADLEVGAGAGPGRRRGPQLRRIPVGPDHPDEGRYPAPARGLANTAADSRRRRTRRHRPRRRWHGEGFAVGRDIRIRFGQRIVVRRHAHAVTQTAQPVSRRCHCLEQLGCRVVVALTECRTGRIVAGHPATSAKCRGQCRDDPPETLTG
jgi:hypothetical protein